MDKDDLRELADDLPDGDPESVVYYPDENGGHFVVEGEIGEADEALINKSGWAITGGIDIPGMTQVNVVEAPVAEDDV